MLLLIDHLALRARNYEYLIRLFQEWEVGVQCRPSCRRPACCMGRLARLRQDWGTPGAPGCLPFSLLTRAHEHACTHGRGGRRRPGTGPYTRAEAPAPGCVRQTGHGKGVECLINDRRGADKLKRCVRQTGLHVTRERFHLFS